MFIALLAHPGLSSGAFDLSALRLIYTGGTTIPTVLMEQLKARMGAECTILFGQTESTASGTMTLDEDSFERKSTTVGKPTPYLDLKIIDPLTGQAVRLGERGEVLLRGFAVMKGYYNMLEKTVETLDRENWLHTGDLATMDAEGYVRVVGRVKDMIIRGGENVYPAEIEQLLMRHAKVADAQVVGVPDARMGEEAAAAIRLKPGEQATSDELREYCLAHISRYKVPRYFLFVMSYPLTASGKIKKFELRTQLMQQLGMQEDVV